MRGVVANVCADTLRGCAEPYKVVMRLAREKNFFESKEDTEHRWGVEKRQRIMISMSRPDVELMRVKLIKTSLYKYRGQLDSRPPDEYADAIGVNVDRTYEIQAFDLRSSVFVLRS